MKKTGILSVAAIVILCAGIQAWAAAGNAGPGHRLEALPAPGQLQPIPQTPQVQQPKVPPPSPAPPVSRGAINPRTGEFYPPQGQGIVNPRTGEYYPPVDGRGYINPKTGEYYPRLQ